MYMYVHMNIVVTYTYTLSVDTVLSWVGIVIRANRWVWLMGVVMRAY